jgi:hypothetical protein
MTEAIYLQGYCAAEHLDGCRENKGILVLGNQLFILATVRTADICQLYTVEKSTASTGATVHCKPAFIAITYFANTFRIIVLFEFSLVVKHDFHRGQVVLQAKATTSEDSTHDTQVSK